MKKCLVVVPLVLLLCFTFACQDKSAMAELKQIKAQGELEKQNEAALRSLLEENDKGNYALMRELCAPDYRLYFPSNAKPITFEEHMQANKAMYAAFPDFKHTIEDVFAKGDKAVFRATLRGTHKESFMGIPPTGKSFEYSAIGIARFKNGKIVEIWLNGDFLGLMQQLGMELKPIEAKKKLTPAWAKRGSISEH